MGRFQSSYDGKEWLGERTSVDADRGFINQFLDRRGVPRELYWVAPAEGLPPEVGLTPGGFYRSTRSLTKAIEMLHVYRIMAGRDEETGEKIDER